MTLCFLLLLFLNVITSTLAQDIVSCLSTASSTPIKIRLRSDWSPHGVRRFRELVELGFFDNSPLFRVIKSFLVHTNPEARASDVHMLVIFCSDSLARCFVLFCCARSVGRIDRHRFSLAFRPMPRSAKPLLRWARLSTMRQCRESSSAAGCRLLALGQTRGRISCSSTTTTASISAKRRGRRRSAK